MRKISIKGVAIGSITDIVATNILMIPLVVYILVTNDFSSIPEYEIQKVLMDYIKNDQEIYGISILSGSLCSVLGGYIAARLAKHDEIINGMLASILCVGGGVYSFMSGSIEGEYIKHIGLLISSPLLAMAGGYLRLHQVATNA